MSNLNINLKDTLKKLSEIKLTSEELQKNFNIFDNSFEKLGNSWRDEEYTKAKKYINSANNIIKSYVKESLAYVEDVESKVIILSKEYLDDANSDSSSLDGLDMLGGLDLNFDNVGEQPERTIKLLEGDLIVKGLGSREVITEYGKKRKANFYVLKPEIEPNNSVNHHILLVDISGSMHDSIGTLKEKVKVCLKQLLVDGNNYVSVITYSGHNESKKIISAVKCDDISYKMADVYNIIDRELYSKGSTVMSEPLGSSLEIYKKLENICSKHHVVLFTDGCLVPNYWSVEAETLKCYAIAQACAENNIILNAVGFGRYYDREFLKNLVSRAGNGIFAHIDEIDDYADAILNMIREVNGNDAIKFDINNNDFFIVKIFKRYNEPATIRNLHVNEDNIIVVFDDELVIGEASFDYGNVVSDDVFNEFLYALTFNHVIDERIDDAEYVIAQTGDINAFKIVNNCYSFEEKGKVLSFLGNVMLDESQRFVEGKRNIEILQEDDEPICLLEILNDIMDDDKSKLLWNLNYKYKRIVQKTIKEDKELSFKYDRNGYVPVKSIEIGHEKLNINVETETYGTVVNKTTFESCPAKIRTEYSLIVNGNVNTSEIWCVLSDELYQKYSKLDLIKSSENYEGNLIYTLDLTKVKATNKRTLKLIPINTIVDNLCKIEDLAIWSREIKSTIKYLVGDGEKIDLSGLSEEEITRRKLFNVDENGFYISERSADLSTEFDVYPVTVMSWSLNKYNGNFDGKYVSDMIDKEIAGMSKKEAYEYLKNKLDSINTERTKLNDKNNIVRISSGLMGKDIVFWEKEEIKSKKKTDKATGKNLVVDEKATISTKNIDGKVFRQDKYKLLVKVN